VGAYSEETGKRILSSVRSVLKTLTEQRLQATPKQAARLVKEIDNYMVTHNHQVGIDQDWLAEQLASTAAVPITVAPLPREPATTRPYAGGGSSADEGTLDGSGSHTTASPRAASPVAADEELVHDTPTWGEALDAIAELAARAWAEKDWNQYATLSREYGRLKSAGDEPGATTPATFDADCDRVWGLMVTGGFDLERMMRKGRADYPIGFHHTLENNLYWEWGVAARVLDPIALGFVLKAREAGQQFLLNLPEDVDVGAAWRREFEGNSDDEYPVLPAPPGQKGKSAPASLQQNARNLGRLDVMGTNVSSAPWYSERRVLAANAAGKIALGRAPEVEGPDRTLPAWALEVQQRIDLANTHKQGGYVWGEPDAAGGAPLRFRVGHEATGAAGGGEVIEPVVRLVWDGVTVAAWRKEEAKDVDEEATDKVAPSKVGPTPVADKNWGKRASMRPDFRSIAEGAWRWLGPVYSSAYEASGQAVPAGGLDAESQRVAIAKIKFDADAHEHAAQTLEALAFVADQLGGYLKMAWGSASQAAEAKAIEPPDEIAGASKWWSEMSELASGLAREGVSRPDHILSVILDKGLVDALETYARCVQYLPMDTRARLTSGVWRVARGLQELEFRCSGVKADTRARLVKIPGGLFSLAVSLTAHPEVTHGEVSAALQEEAQANSDGDAPPQAVARRRAWRTWERAGNELDVPMYLNAVQAGDRWKYGREPDSARTLNWTTLSARVAALQQEAIEHIHADSASRSGRHDARRRDAHIVAQRADEDKAAVKAATQAKGMTPTSSRAGPAGRRAGPSTARGSAKKPGSTRFEVIRPPSIGSGSSAGRGSQRGKRLVTAVSTKSQGTPASVGLPPRPLPRLPIPAAGPAVEMEMRRAAADRIVELSSKGIGERTQQTGPQADSEKMTKDEERRLKGELSRDWARALRGDQAKLGELTEAMSRSGRLSRLIGNVGSREKALWVAAGRPTSEQQAPQAPARVGRATHARVPSNADTEHFSVVEASGEESNGAGATGLKGSDIRSRSARVKITRAGKMKRSTQGGVDNSPHLAQDVHTSSIPQTGDAPAQRMEAGSSGSQSGGPPLGGSRAPMEVPAEEGVATVEQIVRVDMLDMHGTRAG